ncbi:6911_t:CDS:2 [Rhizophagus irregularis]|nr:6911_t:CDS:2 [Rhizophagus irregularis]
MIISHLSDESRNNLKKQCSNINDNVLNGLIELYNTIKELELIIGEDNNNYENNVQLHHTRCDELFCRYLENSSVKHANYIRHFKILSLIKLNRLELDAARLKNVTTIYGNLSLPLLQNLKLVVKQA